MIDLHCHILPGVDDGAPDLETSVAMARLLIELGYHTVAASPHWGEGPGGDVSPGTAQGARERLEVGLEAAGLGLTLLPNAEHHMGPTLFQRLADTDGPQVVPVGGDGRWLLVELPWHPMTDPDRSLFRLQAKGYRILLAHPERYTYLEADQVAAWVERGGVCLQLDLGSFVGVYGRRAMKKARAFMQQGHAHVLGTDLHRAEKSRDWLPNAILEINSRFGLDALVDGTATNPRQILDGVEVGAVAGIRVPG